jgi:hypothetical protein
MGMGTVPVSPNVVPLHLQLDRFMSTPATPV